MTATCVRELMHPGLITCPSQASLGQVATELARRGLHAVLVVALDGTPIGVISDMDLLAGEWLSHEADEPGVARSMTAGQLMCSPLATIEGSAPVPEAAERLCRERIHRLVVTEEGRPVGMLTVRDLVAELAETPAGTLVQDVMSRGIVVCRDDTPVAAAARTMTERRSRSVVVVDLRGRPRGVVAGLELVALLATGARPQTVAEIMRPPLTIPPTASLREAARRMLEARSHRLLVVDPQDPGAMPLGIISTADIVTAMAAPGSGWHDRG